MSVFGKGKPSKTPAADMQLPDPKDIEALAKAYEEDRFAVVKEMGEIAMRRIRSMAANVFADAFVIRKKTPKDGNDG